MKIGEMNGRWAIGFKVAITVILAGVPLAFAWASWVSLEVIDHGARLNPQVLHTTEDDRLAREQDRQWIETKLDAINNSNKDFENDIRLRLIELERGVSTLLERTKK